MIIGVGTDLLDIRRIEQTLDRFGERFCARIYTDGERRRCDRKINRAACYAQRYAAKEACSKALGTGLRDGVFWRDMVIDNLPSGKPVMRLSGGARRRLGDLTPAGMTAVIEVTLTDEYPMAHAVVVISAIAQNQGLSQAP